ncbi:Hypothetical_protein [Hexamita inflata]|uniref:Hypothetical_protein n=1 Tax=Hexamita inflata TaxID=28002 RepID=A0AA86Q8J5_9EUKA|nr:Hypothetical protein HINF_LOCUS38693 [Hexamita inflata]
MFSDPYVLRRRENPLLLSRTVIQVRFKQQTTFFFLILKSISSPPLYPLPLRRLDWSTYLPKKDIGLVRSQLAAMKERVDEYKRRFRKQQKQLISISDDCVLMYGQVNKMHLQSSKK